MQSKLHLSPNFAHSPDEWSMKPFPPTKQFGHAVLKKILASSGWYRLSLSRLGLGCFFSSMRSWRKRSEIETSDFPTLKVDEWASLLAPLVSFPLAVAFCSLLATVFYLDGGTLGGVAAEAGRLYSPWNHQSNCSARTCLEWLQLQRMKGPRGRRGTGFPSPYVRHIGL